MHAARATPEAAVADLEHRREGDLDRSGRLGARFTTHSQKLAKGSDDDKASDPVGVVAGLVAALSRSSPRAAVAAVTTRPARRDTTDRGGGDQGRPHHRPRPAERQRLQRARLQRPQAGRSASSGSRAGRRVQVGGGLRPEHDHARAAGLRPDHRRRVRAGRRDRDGSEEVPEDEVRDRRRRSGDA